MLLPRQRLPRLAYTGGILLGWGMIGLSMVQGFETLAFRLTVFIIVDAPLQQGLPGHVRSAAPEAGRQRKGFGRLVSS